jgi:hypothetical protein
LAVVGTAIMSTSTPDLSGRPIKREKIQESMSHFQISNRIWTTPSSGRNKAGQVRKQLLKSS